MSSTLTAKALVWFLPKASDLNRVSGVALEPKGAGREAMKADEIPAKVHGEAVGLF